MQTPSDRAAHDGRDRELWLLDDGRTFGGGQINALRLGHFITTEETGWGIRIFCPATGELAQRCLAAGIPVGDAAFPDVSLVRAYRIVGAVRALRRTLRSAGTDVIVVGGSMRAQTYAHVATLGLRHRPILVQYMTEQDSARRWVTSRLLRRFGAVVTVGSNAARAYQAALPGQDVVTVNNFLLPGEIRVAPSGRAHSRIGPPAIGVIARLIPEKGVLELIDELAGIGGSWSTLVVGGNADDEAYLRRVDARVTALGLDDRISVVGPFDDLATFMDDIDVVVVPSTGNEGQPTVILEALANSRPVIVRSHIWSDDYDGLPVFPYGDASDLARLLADVSSGASIDVAELERRFGPSQVLDGIEVAARRAREAQGR